MPFRKWSVEPVFLSRKPLPPDKKYVDDEFTAVANGALVQCLLQLSSVAEIADRIFDEIGSEFRLLSERAERLKLKVEVCQDVVSKLNARAVKVPVSDLCETSRFLRRHQPYKTHRDVQTQFFLPSTRPPCVDQLYQQASATPVALMATVDRYRTDGLTASQIFMVTPVLGGGPRKRKHRKHLDIETRKPANHSLAREQQEDDSYDLSSYSALVSPSIGGNLRQNASHELERLPSPEEQALYTALEYPSIVVPVDTSGSTFNRMSILRRSLIHVDFVIRRKKDKRKSKRRHTVCEGDSKEIEKAIRDISVAHSSCQTDDVAFDVMSSNSNTILRSLSRRRSRSTMDNSRRKSSDLELDVLKPDCKASEESIKDTTKKSKLSAIKAKACNFNPLSSISAAITMAAVKMRQSTRTGKQDDGRSSSGNWSASSSTRASVDSDHQHATTPVDGVSSPSRNSVGKDSLLSDITHQDMHSRSRDDIPIQNLTKSPSKQKRYTPVNPPWAFDPGSTHSHIPDLPPTSAIRSPYAGRKGNIDDGDSSVYSVDTDGYYTSMHTDSGLWCNALDNLQKPSDLNGEGYRKRQESQSSVSTIGNSSINSFLSNKSATECSSSNSSSSLKRRHSVIPKPPPRGSSCNKMNENESPTTQSQGSDSTPPHQGSASESDFDVGDRIRVKTTITSFRYPSMCAVSPETSDDEIGDWKNTSNVIVAEVHREDRDGKDRRPIQSNVPSAENQRLNNPIINMYRSETPVQSCFSSQVQQRNQVTTSTPRSDIAISTFAPDLQDFSDSSTNKTGSSEDLKSMDDGFIITGKPVSPLTIGSVPDKSLIPLKYAQHITVTPISRNSPSKMSGLNNPRPSPIQQYSSDYAKTSIGRQSPSPSISSYVSYRPPDSPVKCSSPIIKSYSSVPSSPTGSLSRAGARVTLDPSGKVVFASNSLDRTERIHHNTKFTHEGGYSTLPTYQSPPMENVIMTSSNMLSTNSPTSPASTRNESMNSKYRFKIDPKPAPEALAVEESIPTIPPAMNTLTNNYSQGRITPTNMTSLPPLPISSSSAKLNLHQSSPSFAPSLGRDFNFRPSRGGRLCRSYFPSHLISPSNQTPAPTKTEEADNSRIKSYIPPSNLYRTKYSQPSMQASPQVPSYNRGYHLSQPVNSPESAVPNKGSIYSSSTPLSQGKRNTDYKTSSVYSPRLDKSKYENPYTQTHIKSNYSKPTFISKPPDLIPSGASPPSTLDITSPVSQIKRTSELKPMSATELFAIIHNSKKKHNIKTESEKSMSPLSSRSASPALSQCSLPSKLQPVETGILSKPGAKPIDRTNWNNSLPSSYGRRALTAQDKLSNVKPTSMRDFKMLLLQTRTGVLDSNPKPSAAELLKVSPPKTQGLQSPTGRITLSPSSPAKSPASLQNLIPVKRNRARSPYLARYDNAYPVILEDCSEELESNHDNRCLSAQSSSAMSRLYQEQKKVPVQCDGPSSKATSTWV